MNKKTRSFTPQEKAQVALTAIKEEKTMAQISSDFQVHPTQIGLWKKQALDNLAELFKDGRKKEKDKQIRRQAELDNLYKIIGQRDMELEWLKKNCNSLTHEQKISLIEKNNQNIALKRQCQLLGVSRASWYYQPAPSGEEDKKIMDLIDVIYTQFPFYGSRKIKEELNRTYLIPIGRGHTRTLMQDMGIEAIYPKKKLDLSLKNNDCKIYPYLLRNFKITAPNQVWGSDITYVRLETGFAYLVAIIDWFSRYVIAWKLSNSLEIGFCLECLSEALTQGRPMIFNTDQGSHFTSLQFTGILKSNQVQISMDGRGRYMDNIFTERLWRTVKQENIYLNSYRDVGQARRGLNEYFSLYNNLRRHESLDYQRPTEVHFQKISQTNLTDSFHLVAQNSVS